MWPLGEKDADTWDGTKYVGAYYGHFKNPEAASLYLGVPQNNIEASLLAGDISSVVLTSAPAPDFHTFMGFGSRLSNFLQSAVDYSSNVRFDARLTYLGPRFESSPQLMHHGSYRSYAP